jgi:hypothetical protein
MTITVLVCTPSGEQALETRDVPDDYIPAKEAPAE